MASEARLAKSKERESEADVSLMLRAGHLPAVEQHEVVVGADAAHRDLRAFAVDAIDRHAGDALQRLGEVGIRELADVLGDDAVDDADASCA